MKPQSKRGMLLGLILATVAALTTVLATSAEAEWTARTYQNAATAIPASPGDVVSDVSSKVYRVSSGPVRGTAVATASTTCDSCSADAVTMQVLYARNVRTIKVNNVAAAWSACTGCRGSALSLQIVIARRAEQLVANNRSLAVNATCQGCLTAAAAVQIVLISPKENHLSQSAIRSLVALRDQLHQQLLAEVAPPPTARALPMSRASAASDSPVDQTVLEMQQLLATDVQASSASHDVQLHVG